MEHLKAERTRADHHASRLRTLYSSFSTTEALCKAIYVNLDDDRQSLTLGTILPNAVKIGFMTKKARDSSNWRLRFFVLLENFLFYFKSESDMSASPRGVVRLDDGTVSYADNPTKTELKNLHVLCVTAPNNNGAKETKPPLLYLAAEPAVLDGWMEVLKNAAGYWTRKSSIMLIQKSIKMRERASTISRLASGTTASC